MFTNPDFRWGVATAAYQIEGAVTEDGRGPSIWDTFTQVADGHTGAVACDHYHRWPEDVELMAGLGIDSYRFSVSWTRVLPTGGGPVNTRGLDFYSRLVDALLERGISPVPTLYHWDLPQALEDKGGWLDRDTAYRFAEYAYLVAERLADRVDLWMTLNEPVVTMAYGYAFGTYAPGRALMLDALPAAHHQLLAHGLATTALRSRGATQIGIANHYIPAWPASPAEPDVGAAAAFDALINKLFTDPILLGSYPDLSAFGPLDLSFVRDADLAVISQPIDALGVNYYQPNRIAHAEGVLPFDILPVEGRPRTSLGWPVAPEAFQELLVGLKDTYGPLLPPLYITENGCSYEESLDDRERIAFLDSHLKAAQAAVDQGVDLRGYFVWSLMDNFEWAEGYHPRFGLVHIDYATQKRTPRRSYAWYRDLIAGQAASTA
ncbi:MAG: GH1 family beta-glucosidase [Streptosporangiaceae bacterium]